MSRSVVTILADVQPRLVEWLWTYRIPLGMLTIFDGDPGLGKSTILLDIAARLSRGDLMPDGSPGPGVAGAVVLTAEDDIARVVRPRLDAAGADLARIATASVKDRDGERDPSITADDLPVVEEAVHRVGAKLVIIDPLMAYLPGEVNSNRDQDVRRALVRLRDLGEQTGAAIVVVRHLNKAVGGSALYRGGGSIGIIGAARSGLLLAADPAAPDSGRVLAITKANLSAKAPSLRLQLVQDGHDFPGVRWGGTCDLTAAQLLSAGEKPDRRSARNSAVSFLRDLLAQGPMAQKEVERRALEAGISAETLRRARRELGVKSGKAGRPTQPDQHWIWRLPQADGDREVSHHEADPLREEYPSSTLSTEPGPKRVTDHEGGHSGGDLLREDCGIPALRESSVPKGVISDVDLLRERIGDHPPLSESLPKGVTSTEDSGPPSPLAPADLLREEARQSRAEAISRPEEGQLEGIDPLRVDDMTDGCPRCGGRMLSWSWGSACTGCHSRVSDDDPAELLAGDGCARG